MLRNRSLLFVVILTTVLIIPATTEAQFNGTLSGQVRTNPSTSFSYPTRLVVALHPKTGGSPGDVISQEFRIGGSQEPYPFTLTYATSRIKTNLTYVLDVKIAIGTDGQYQKLDIALTNGQLPPNIPITLDKASFYVPETGTGSWLLLLSGLLAALGGAVALWRRQQAHSLIPRRA
jgi:LPXTG-motif cell wall-anchored protein